jgi:hypothetical protein
MPRCGVSVQLLPFIWYIVLQGRKRVVEAYITELESVLTICTDTN